MTTSKNPSFSQPLTEASEVDTGFMEKLEAFRDNVISGHHSIL